MNTDLLIGISIGFVLNGLLTVFVRFVSRSIRQSLACKAEIKSIRQKTDEQLRLRKEERQKEEQAKQSKDIVAERTAVIHSLSLCRTGQP